MEVPPEVLDPVLDPVLEPVLELGAPLLVTLTWVTCFVVYC